MKGKFALIGMTVLVASALAFGQGHSKIQSTAQWEKMKTLVGHWDGTMQEGKDSMPATESFRMTGDGSALMHLLGEGSQYEMVTMFHPDGPKLMMTHYCAAHNQPRMRAVETEDPNKIVFEFVDVTNAAPGDAYMYRVTFTFDGPDHHLEEWTNKQGDKETTGKFDFKRSK